MSDISGILGVPINSLQWMDRSYFKQKEMMLYKSKQTPTMNINPDN